MIIITNNVKNFLFHQSIRTFLLGSSFISSSSYFYSYYYLTISGYFGYSGIASSFFFAFPKLPN